MPKIKRALISVSDKAGVVQFAKVLHGMGVVILSTGGTANVLRDAKIPVTDVSDYTGSPEILDGRLKTLHPKIYGGLLGIRGNSKHVKEMKANGIEPIDMVVVNLYPFEATIVKDSCTFEDAIENIDIGGPTMLRAAAKNWQDVAVVVDPTDYEMIIEELKNSLQCSSGGALPPPAVSNESSGGALSPPAGRGQGEGVVSSGTCFKLAQKVFATTARYDAAICNYINSLPLPSGERAGVRGEFPSTLALTFEKTQDLRYGENPHQKAAFYKEFPSPLGGEGQGEGAVCISSARQLHGKELSYNNIMDADAAIELAREFADKTATVIIKHTNPCGVAVQGQGSRVKGSSGGALSPSAESLADVFINARDCDPTSAFGGVVALTRNVDEATAKAIGDTFFEVIIAPKFEEKALNILKAKKNLRLLEIGIFPSPSTGDGRRDGHVFPPLKKGGEGGFNLRKVRGGLLVQDYDDIATDVSKCKIVTKRKPTKEELVALDFAWRVVKHVKSNAIVIGGVDRIYGVGAGQTSRVDSVKIAIEKKNDVVAKFALPCDVAQDFSPANIGRPKGLRYTSGRASSATTPLVTVLASDAFFPFRDNIDLAAKAGVTAIVQPGGSIRDDESIKAADEHNITMVFTAVRHFRH